MVSVASGSRRYPELPYVLPFAIFVLLLAFSDYLAKLGAIEYPLRVAVLAAVIYTVSRPVLDFRVRFVLGTILLGLAVMVIWVAPDLLIPGYRNHWLFSNSITGGLKASMPENLRSDTVVLVFRFIRAAIIVPIVEELFWRGWLMRWLIDRDFERVPLGTYTPFSMWVTALLFASEHGPYWEVGLVAGLLYNWWIVRTKSLGDCILAHAITNAALSAFVLMTGRWEYWF